MKKIIALLLVMVLSLFCLSGVLTQNPSPSINSSMVMDGPGDVPPDDEGCRDWTATALKSPGPLLRCAVYADRKEDI